MAKRKKVAADYILPLNINGLQGRMLRLPAQGKHKREILFLYGSHSSLERWWGLAEELSKLGNLTMPDFPGLGGMTPFYRIGRQPDLDNLADYLATFIKLKYRNKKVSIVGMSLGFVIATRMLQKYPELTSKVDNLVSIVGFAHRDDLIFSKKRLFIYRTVSKVFSRKWPAVFFRHIILNPFFIKLAYHRTLNAKEKFEGMDKEQFRRTMEIEVGLWHSNDIRTQFKNYLEMFSLDNTQVRVNLPVCHVSAKKDRFFNNVLVEQHMRRIFSDFEGFYTDAPNHAPTVIATSKEAAPFFPPGLRQRFKSKK